MAETKIVLNRQSDLILDNAQITAPVGIVMADIDGLVSSVNSIDTHISTDISSEASARVSGDASLAAGLSTEVAGREAAVSAEESARIAGDASLASNLSSEVSNREAAVSTEASLQTVFDLLDPENLKTKAWLKNTLVILDPCLNPDGRERYVNFYNPIRNSIPDALPFAREHMEPWPGGRSNHYYFDLNRKDLNAMIYLKKRIGIGLNYRVANSFSGILHINVFKNSIVGISYDYTTNKFTNAYSNTFEVMFGITPLSGDEKYSRSMNVVQCPSFDF